MIKKLIENLKTQKELLKIKKHFRIAKRHKSCEELENVTFELLDFQNKLVEEKILSEFMANEIHSLFSDIDYARLKLMQIDRNLVSGYDI